MLCKNVVLKAHLSSGFYHRPWRLHAWGAQRMDVSGLSKLDDSQGRTHFLVYSQKDPKHPSINNWRSPPGRPRLALEHNANPSRRAAPLGWLAPGIRRCSPG
jgi:hypothetical protein